MIFLTIGSWHKGFDRLIKAVDELKGQGVITEDVHAQIGDGKYIPKNLIACKYYSPTEFVRIIGRARVVIAHAGMGAIIEGVKQGKAVVVVPRMKKLGEANTDHQFDTARTLEAEGEVIVAYKPEDLAEKLKEAEGFVPSQGKGSHEIIDAVQAFIDDVIVNRCT